MTTYAISLTGRTGKPICMKATIMRITRRMSIATLILFNFLALQWNPASAGALNEIFESLAAASKVAMRAEERVAVIEAARKLPGVAAVLSVNEAGVLQLTKLRAGVAGAAVLLEHGDDVLRATHEVVGTLLVTPEVLGKHGSELKALVETQRISIKVTEKDSTTIPVELQMHAGGPDLVVRKSERLSFSPGAWAKRGLLDQPLMKDLASRLRVIALVPATDVVQRARFIERFGSRVVFVDKEAEMTAALKQMRQRLVVVVGHVENNAFVVRAPDNAILLKHEITNVHQAIDAGESVAVLMGCDIACKVPASGPIEAIDAFQVLDGLTGGITGKTPMEFLTVLADTVGPLYIDTDVLGRLRVASAAATHFSDRLARGGPIIRVLFASELSPATTLTEMVATVILAVPMFWIFGWIALIPLGISPRVVWRTIKENYASSVGRDESEIEYLSKIERVLLYAFGPAALVVVMAVNLVNIGINIVLIPVAVLLYPLIRAICPVVLDAINEIEREVGRSYEPVFKSSIAQSGRGPGLLFCGMAAALFGCMYYHLADFQITPSDEQSLGLIVMLFCASAVLVVWRMRLFPTLGLHLSVARYRFLVLAFIGFWAIWWLGQVPESVTSVIRKWRWVPSN